MQFLIKLYEVLRQMRWHQWYKGFFTFFALLWIQHQSYSAVILVFTGAIAFNLASSIVYIINDFSDIERDKKHPVKKRRPLASGSMNILEVLSVMVFLMGIVLMLVGVLHNSAFAALLLSYLLLNLLYTYYIKHIPYLDILFVAGFAGMRVAAGFILLGIPVSWLMVSVVVTLFLFIMTVQRLAEVSVKNYGARPVVEKYSPKALKFMMTLFMMLSVILYFGALSLVALPLVYTDVLYFFVLLAVHEYMNFSESKKEIAEDGYTFLLHHRQSLVLFVLLILSLIAAGVLFL